MDIINDVFDDVGRVAVNFNPRLLHHFLAYQIWSRVAGGSNRKL